MSGALVLLCCVRAPLALSVGASTNLLLVESSVDRRVIDAMEHGRRAAAWAWDSLVQAAGGDDEAHVIVDVVLFVVLVAIAVTALRRTCSAWRSITDALGTVLHTVSLSTLRLALWSFVLYVLVRQIFQAYARLTKSEPTMPLDMARTLVNTSMPSVHARLASFMDSTFMRRYIYNASVGATTAS